MKNQERALRRLVQGQFRGCTPRISSLRPVAGAEFAIQCRVTGRRAIKQFLLFERVILIKFTQGNVITTFQGSLTPGIDITFQLHVALIEDTGR